MAGGYGLSQDNGFAARATPAYSLNVFGDQFDVNPAASALSAPNAIYLDPITAFTVVRDGTTDSEIGQYNVGITAPTLSGGITRDAGAAAPNKFISMGTNSAVLIQQSGTTSPVALQAEYWDPSVGSFPADAGTFTYLVSLVDGAEGAEQGADANHATVLFFDEDGGNRTTKAITVDFTNKNSPVLVGGSEVVLDNLCNNSTDSAALAAQSTAKTSATKFTRIWSEGDCADSIPRTVRIQNYDVATTGAALVVRGTETTLSPLNAGFSMQRPSIAAVNGSSDDSIVIVSHEVSPSGNSTEVVAQRLTRNGSDTYVVSGLPVSLGSVMDLAGNGTSIDPLSTHVTPMADGQLLVTMALNNVTDGSVIQRKIDARNAAGLELAPEVLQVASSTNQVNQVNVAASTNGMQALVSWTDNAATTVVKGQQVQVQEVVTGSSSSSTTGLVDVGAAGSVRPHEAYQLLLGYLATPNNVQAAMQSLYSAVVNIFADINNYLVSNAAAVLANIQAEAFANLFALMQSNTVTVNEVTTLEKKTLKKVDIWLHHPNYRVQAESLDAAAAWNDRNPKRTTKGYYRGIGPMPSKDVAAELPDLTELAGYVGGKVWGMTKSAARTLTSFSMLGCPAPESGPDALIDRPSAGAAAAVKPQQSR